MPTHSILILANGTWEHVPRALDCAEKASMVIATDGAWAKAATAGIAVDCVVGDLDSLQPSEKTALLASGIQVQIHPREKDSTDLELAVDLALARKPQKVIVFGAFGGRIDHALANVLMLERVVADGVEVMLIAGCETSWIVNGLLTLDDVAVGDRISLLSLATETVVRTEGLRYPLADESLYRSSARGVSNEVVHRPVQIAISSGMLLVVHGPAEPPLGANP